MAHAITTDADFAHHPTFPARFLAACGRFFMRCAEARSRHREIAAPTGLGDDELAAMGLTREGIARHVFSVRFYL